MINRIRKMLTGYSTASRSFNGRSYRFKFSGKPVFFDPSQMLSEVIKKENEILANELDSIENFESLLKRLPERPDDLLPTVICSFKAGDKKIDVTRYSLKHDNYPVSQYIFEENDKVIGVFCRIYDYGFLVKKFISKMDNKIKIKTEGDTAWKWKTSDASWLMLEKFGHTQLWVWNGPIEKFH